MLMTQPGVGPVTALAFVVTIGDVTRFPRGKQVASYLGLIPTERSSGSKRRLGAISKQGNVFLRTMLVEAAQSAVRHDEEFKKEYVHRCHKKPKGVAKVAAARKLAVRLYWMLRTQTPYAQVVRNEGSSSHSLVGLSQTVPLSEHPRIRHRPGVRQKESWPQLKAVSMAGGT